MKLDKNFYNIIKNSQKKSFFITGTDTDVGKTFITCKILNYFNNQGITSIGYKPFCSGSLDDIERIALSSGIQKSSVDKLYSYFFKYPASPLSVDQNFIPDINLIKKNINDLELNYNLVITEGIGGWETPISPKFMLSDIIKELSIPIILVAEDKLGMLNHTILTIKSIKNLNLNCLAIIVNQTKNNNGLSENVLSNFETLNQINDLPPIFVNTYKLES